MSRVYNFSAGPAALPLEVLETIRNDLPDWLGTGMSVMEVSHRGADFVELAARAEATLRELLQVPDDYSVLFPQGGATMQMAMAPMVRVANAGVPVLIVPGNHERSQIPNHLWGVHPGIKIFDRPRTFEFTFHGLRIAFSGIPFTRKIRDKFPSLVEDTGFKDSNADLRFLCMHQTVEGAKVGTANYIFRSGAEVIRGMDIPRGFAVVLGGHIHRSQVLRDDLRGRELAAPVVYPGSVERTSFAERDEAKHFVIVHVAGSGGNGGELADVSFVPLPARPMVNLVIKAEGMDEARMSGHLRQRFSDLDPDSVVRVQVEGDVPDSCRKVLSAPCLRNLAPPSMNVSMAIHWQVKKVSR